MLNDQSAASDSDKQAEELLRLNGLTADSQPSGLDRSQRRLVVMAVFFVIFCLAIAAMTSMAKP